MHIVDETWVKTVKRNSQNVKHTLRKQFKMLYGSKGNEVLLMFDRILGTNIANKAPSNKSNGGR